jgi:putative membrane protein
MKQRLSFLSLICAGTFLLTTSSAAQAPGGGPPAGQSTPPMSETRPGMNNPTTDSATTAMPSKVDDKKFVQDAAIGGLTELELGKLALQKASSNDVKEFAQKMIDDHTKANETLKQVATREKIDVPESLDSKHQSRIDKLAKLSGDQFDKAYVKDQLKDHQADVGTFTAEAQNGSVPNVKLFASSTLPTLQQHLELVKNLQKSEKKSPKQTKSTS